MEPNPPLQHPFKKKKTTINIALNLDLLCQAFLIRGELAVSNAWIASLSDGRTGKSMSNYR